MIPIETSRLVIQNFTPDDWRELQEMIIQHQATDASRYEDPWPTSDEDMKNITTMFAKGDEYLAVRQKTSGNLIGFLAMNRRTEEQDIVHNLGYIFHPSHHGQGYATESCRRAMKYLFEELKVDRILTGTNPDNKSSIALLTRLGFTRIGRDEYTITQKEWLYRIDSSS